MWRVELMSDEPGYVAKEISKQRFEGLAWFLLLLIVKWKKKETN